MLMLHCIVLEPNTKLVLDSHIHACMWHFNLRIHSIGLRAVLLKLTIQKHFLLAFVSLNNT